MEAQVLKSLAKLRKLCTRSHKELRDVIDAASTAMTAAAERSKSGGEASHGGVGGATEVPFEPFLLACLTRHAKLVALALDCIEKFLAFGFLKGNGAIPDGIRKRLVQKSSAKKVSATSSLANLVNAASNAAGYGNSISSTAVNASAAAASSANGGGVDGDALDGGAGGSGGGSSLNEENWKLIDCIVEVICDCNDHPDETVQIQVLRVLLTAVTTTTCEVHEHSLLKAVRACYHIHLVSKNATNQAVAKATLQQIIAIVFQRMETFDQRVQEETAATLKESLQKSEAQAATNAAITSAQEAQHSEETSSAQEAQSLIANSTSCWYPDVARTLDLAGSPAAIAPANGDSVTSECAVAPRPSINTVFAPPFPSVLHKDAFLLFRSLCRISMRSVAEDSTLSGSGAGGSSASGTAAGSANGGAMEDPFAFQSKLLSLELVLSIINNAGPSFRSGERFVHAIRQYLCQSLLQNCTSNYTQIVGLSLQVFLVLINNFKRHLKAEIEIFVTSIFLRILQSENSSFEHKMLVLEVLNNLCDDASILGEIFLNYDCDWNTNDLFKQIIDALAKIAKGKKDTTALYANLSSSVRLKMQQNDAALVLKGLECMTATVASLKKAANFVEIERKTSQQRTNSGLNSAGDGDDDNTAPNVVVPVTMGPSSSSGSSTLSAVEAFDRKKKRQEELATGILKFNVKPTAGIQYLVQHGHMGQGTPRDVALFLSEHNSKLDKTQVGEYLGKELQYQGGFCIKVLHEFVDMMDFTGLEIDVAIRVFLAGFRLPGESQKIDRMMEKFAERYYSSCTPGLFPSADTAFILSFSIIMLQTDLHNPSIPEEKKMDKAGFLRNNRGINNGEDLPDEYMGGIFDRIKQSPISLKEDDDYKERNGLKKGGGGNKGAVSDRQRRDAYIKERETIMRQSEALFKRRNPAGMSIRGLPVSPRGSVSSSGPSSPGQQFHLVTEFTEMTHVRPMFETVWAPLLACCSVIFESSDAPVAIQLCLNSFKHAIHLAARLNMPSERDAFVTVLSKFTALHTTSTRLMRSKNIEAIKALISISVKEGNYLGDAWRDILQAISQLARIQTHAQGLDTQFFNQPSQSSPAVSTPSNSGGAFSSFSSTSSFTSSMSRRTMSSSATAYPSPSHRELLGGGAMAEDQYNPAIEDENAARVMAEIDSLASDRVFSSSVSLSDTAIQEFVLQLCVVSLTECSGAAANNGRPSNRQHDSAFSPPRVFSLQKLVEVADMNMNMRSRVVWATTWKVLSRHFTTIGCHDNLSVAMYAIDSLRQLSMKFLEREELKDFNFQRLFLTPFEVIMANAISMEIRELVLRCIENMILARVVNIKSGWKTIWGVLRVAAETYDPSTGGGDQPDRVVQLGFQISKRIFEQHFDRIIEVFVDAVECLLAFAVCGCEEVEKNMPEQLALTQLSIDSIAILQNVCMNKLAAGQVIEKLFVEGSVAKRVGFKAKKKTNGTASEAPVDGEQTTTIRARYHKQESSRSLEEEIAAQTPPSSPRRRSSSYVPPAAIINENEEASPVTIYNDSSAHTRMWWPVLTALSTLAADRRIDVRLAALYALYDSLDTHGRQFSTGLWSLIFKGVLIPLLDELRHLEVYVERGSRPQPKIFARDAAKKATSTLCLERLLECFGRYYDIVGFLPEVLFLLGKCMDTSDNEEELAYASAAALEQMLVVHGHKFPDDVWGLIADELRSVMTRAEPTWVFFALPPPPPRPESPPVSPSVPGAAVNGLLSPRGPPSLISMYPGVMAALQFTFTKSYPPKVVTDEEVNAQQFPARTHLAVMLALQNVMGNVLSSRFSRQLALSEGHVSSLTACLRDSFAFARKVNDAHAVREYFQTAGWQYGKAAASDLPSLLPQEVQGKVAYANVLFSLITAPSGSVNDKQRDVARRQMTQLVKQTMDEYLLWSTEGDAPRPADAAQRTAHYNSLIVGILTQFATFEAPEVRYVTSYAWPHFVSR